MKKLMIKQINQISRVTEMTSLKRNASEQEDVRIEGQGVSIRLPFLPTLQRLLFQDKPAIDFYRDRVNEFKSGLYDIDGFDCPTAVFNFLLPSYHLTLLNVDIVESPINIGGFDDPVDVSIDRPGFNFTYRTSKYNFNGDPVMLNILITSSKCHVSQWSGLGGRTVATCLIECIIKDEIELDPIPY